MENKHEMYIENKKTTSEHSVKLLGIEIHNQLNFDNMYQHYAKKQVPGFLDLENTLVFQKKRLSYKPFYIQILITFL